MALLASAVKWIATKARGTQPMRKRAYAAARQDRLTANWTAQNLSMDSELRYALKTLRARSRELEQNNDYAKKFFQLVTGNVVGPAGFTLKNGAKDPSGKPDKAANQQIEEAFRRWSRKGVFDVTGTLSRTDGERLFIQSVARDGEVLIRKIKGWKGNEFRYALQFLEADHLDETLNRELDGGHTITMGVEHDQWRKPVAYHLLNKHPGDASYTYLNKTYTRVPADEIIHEFVPVRIGQLRGLPWAHSAMTRLNMIGGYEEAELVAARVGASKMGFFTSATGEEYTGDSKDEAGNLITEVEPGVFEKLPPGVEFTPFEPDHPTGNFGPFMKSVLRGIASGLGVSYNGLASDLEGVNYSSIRAGVLEERDVWRMVQHWMIQHFCELVFADWLDMALLTGQVRLPADKFVKFNAPVFRGRGWTWVDPKNDIEAAVGAINKGLKTRTQILAEQGLDRDEVFSELAEEEKAAKLLGIDVNADSKGGAESKEQPDEEPAAV